MIQKTTDVKHVHDQFRRAVDRDLDILFTLCISGGRLMITKIKRPENKKKQQQ